MSAAHPTSAGRALIVIPTYNEIESLEGVVRGVLALGLHRVDVLVVDDGSPDGTGRLADTLAAESGRVAVLHRTSKDGLGRAYLAGFAWGLEHGYEVFVEMDADGSHPLGRLDALIATARAGTGTVIGSRWVPGGGVSDWSEARQRLSRAGNAYARAVLGIRVLDATSGFRAYRAETLHGIHLDDVHSRGYCFQIDMTLRALDTGSSIREIPIEFRERAHGTSKMSKAIVAEAMLRVTYWGVLRLFRRISGRLPAPVPARVDSSR